MSSFTNSNMPHTAQGNGNQPPSPAGTPGTPARVESQYSMIGKSMVIKGEITATDPLHINGRVEGKINAPEQRVTIGKEGAVKADISAREVVIMGDVCGNLKGSDRVEIRSDGSLMGELVAHRVCIEDGAFLKGAVDVRRPAKEAKPESQQVPLVDPHEDAPVAEDGQDQGTSEDFALSELR